MFRHLTSWLGDRLVATGATGLIARTAAFVLLLFPILFMCAYSYLQIHNTLTQSALTRRQAYVDLAALSLKEKFDHLTDLALSLATRVGVRQYAAEGQWDKAMERLVDVPKRFPYIDRIFLADLEGTQKAGSPPLGTIGKNFRERDWFTGVTRDWKPYVSEVYRRTAEPQFNVISVAVPIEDEKAKPRGILVLQIRLDTLRQWAEQNKTDPTSVTYFVDPKGHLAAHPRFDPQGKIVDVNSVPVVKLALQGKRGIMEQYNPVEAEQRVSAYAPVESYGWAVVVGQPIDDAYAVRNRTLRFVLGTEALIVLIGALLACLVLSTLVERRRVEKALRESEENYHILFDSIDEGFCIFEMIFDERGKAVDYRFLQINPSFEKQTGLKNAQGKRMRELAPRHEEHWFEIYGKIALTGQPVHFVNRAEQLHRWFEVYAFRFGDPKNRQVAALFSDITGRKQVEETVKQKSLELEQSNKELEAFSYSVSHDLRAPLRAIEGFSRIIEEDYSERLDDEGRRLFGVVRANTRQMGELIDDLLAFSRLSRKGVENVEIDMTPIVHQVLEEQIRELSERHVRLDIGELPKALGDVAMIRQVWVNLISNALKFTGKQKEPRIEIQGSRDKGEVTYSVKDNGVGFDMSYSDKLFGVFQRLHRSDEFEGTGVGLAIVQRIIHRHGGRVWADAKINQGATFFFTLPTNEETK